MKGEPKLKGLKALRLANNLTQEELANLLGVSVRQVCRWETEDSKPRTTELELRLCEILGCTVAQLWGFTQAA